MRFSKHPGEDAIDDYALGQAHKDQQENIEEHLLVCEQCRVEMAATDAIIKALKTESSADLKSRFQVIQGKRRTAGSA